TREKSGSVGLKEIRGYYESHPEEFHIPDRVKWLDIFISVGKFESEKRLDAANAKRAAYDYASIIQMHAEAGEDFPALSRKYDNGLAGQVNGIGLGSERGAIQPPEVEPIVWSLKVGEVSKLIETPAGYHIVKVVERDYAGIKPFDDRVQLEAKRRLQHVEEEAEYKKLVEKLWRLGVVKIVEMP
ncbi:MAG TPA: peptidylprolyl isomerase, partial [Urbifossiella sp.]